MSQSLRYLKFAVHEFALRPTGEDVDHDELREVVEVLEAELEMLLDPREEHAVALAELDVMVEEIFLQRSQWKAVRGLGWRVLRHN